MTVLRALVRRSILSRHLFSVKPICVENSYISGAGFSEPDCLGLSIGGIQRRARKLQAAPRKQELQRGLKVRQRYRKMQIVQKFLKMPKLRRKEKSILEVLEIFGLVILRFCFKR